jgi:glycosyltransferase involved in cell wall biosynthesis
MLISVITVCKNEEEGISRTLDSILTQSFSDYELILVDGASEDKTLNNISEYKPFIHQFISEKDEGIYHAMNKGLNMSNGDYVIFMNGGDQFYNENSLELFVQKIGYDLIYGQAKMSGSDFVFSPSDNLSMRFFRKNMLPHQATMYRKSLFEQIGNYDESYKIAGDYEFNVRLFSHMQPSYCHINAPLAIFDTNGISSSKNMRCLRKKENHRICMKYFPSYRFSWKSIKQQFRNRFT